jgi:hypothetical protein
MPFGCSSKIEIKESPAKPVAREFLQAVSQSDIDAAWNLVDPAQKKMLTIERFKAACKRLLKKANLDQPTVQIKACTDKDGKAIAHAALAKGSKRFRIDIELWYQNETWVVHLGRDFF